VRCEQLDHLLQWGAEFRQSSLREGEGEKVLEDLVAFDVLLGDLNFDNCSSGNRRPEQPGLLPINRSVIAVLTSRLINSPTIGLKLIERVSLLSHRDVTPCCWIIIIMLYYF